VPRANNNRDSPFDQVQVHSIVACAELPLWSASWLYALGMWHDAPSQQWPTINTISRCTSVKSPFFKALETTFYQQSNISIGCAKNTTCSQHPYAMKKTDDWLKRFTKLWVSLFTLANLEKYLKGRPCDRILLWKRKLITNHVWRTF